MAQVVTDKFGRPIRDLRISVTDKCNFRCRYLACRKKFSVMILNSKARTAAFI